MFGFCKCALEKGCWSPVKNQLTFVAALIYFWMQALVKYNFFFVFFESSPYITLLSWRKLYIIPGATCPHFPFRFFWSLNPAIKWSHAHLFDTWVVQCMGYGLRNWNRFAVISPKFNRAKLVLMGSFLGLGGILELEDGLNLQSSSWNQLFLKTTVSYQAHKLFIVLHMKLYLRKFVFAWVKMCSIKLLVLNIF